MLAKQNAAAFPYASVSVVKVAHGAKVRVKDPVSGKFLSFTITVAKATVIVVSNF